MIAKRKTLASSAATVVPHEAVLDRMRGEFLEMPGLRLTREQAQRLCGVDQALCQQVLDTLVDASFLCVKPNGAYARRTDGADIARPHPAKADLRTGTFSVKASG
jgi:hypothetical protein